MQLIPFGRRGRVTGCQRNRVGGNSVLTWDSSHVRKISKVHNLRDARDWWCFLADAENWIADLWPFLSQITPFPSEIGSTTDNIYVTIEYPSDLPDAKEGRRKTKENRLRY